LIIKPKSLVTHAAHTGPELPAPQQKRVFHSKLENMILRLGQRGAGGIVVTEVLAIKIDTQLEDTFASHLGVQLQQGNRAGGPLMRIRGIAAGPRGFDILTGHQDVQTQLLSFGKAPTP
jgi:hypothetical protein